MARTERIDIRLEPDLLEAVRRRAKRLADKSGRVISQSAGARDLIRIAVQGADKADANGWLSGYSEGVKEGLRDLIACLATLSSVLDSGVEPKAVVESLKGLLDGETKVAEEPVKAEKPEAKKSKKAEKKKDGEGGGFGVLM